MHEELRTPEAAVRRLAHDTLVHLVRKPGHLRMVRVAIPAAWDAMAFQDAMVAVYAERGWEDVQVVVLATDGDPRLLSVVV